MVISPEENKVIEKELEKSNIEAIQAYNTVIREDAIDGEIRNTLELLEGGESDADSAKTKQLTSWQFRK